MNEPVTLICPKCARPTPPGADYCPECSAPLTAHSVYDPFDTILTTGYMYREASQRPKAPIVVVGIVMLLGPMFLISTYLLVLGVVELFRRPNQFEWWTIPLFAVFGAAAYVSGAILMRTFENFQNHVDAADSTKQAGDDEEEDEAEEWWNEAEAGGTSPDEDDDGDDPPETPRPDGTS